MTEFSSDTCQRPKHQPHKTLSMVFSPSLLKQRRKHHVQRLRGSATWDCHDEDLNFDLPDDVLLDTLKRGSEGDAQEMLRAVRRRIRAKQCSDVPMGGGGSHCCDGKHSGMTPMTVVSAPTATLDPRAERAAARAGSRQGQRAEELECMFDDAGADVIALEHRLQTSRYTPAPAHKARLE